MDFVVVLPLTSHRHNAILVIVDKLTKSDGNASAGGLVAVVIANIVAFFLVRIVGRNLEA